MDFDSPFGFSEGWGQVDHNDNNSTEIVTMSTADITKSSSAIPIQNDNHNIDIDSHNGAVAVTLVSSYRNTPPSHFMKPSFHRSNHHSNDIKSNNLTPNNGNNPTKFSQHTFKMNHNNDKDPSPNHKNNNDYLDNPWAAPSSMLAMNDIPNIQMTPPVVESSFSTRHLHNDHHLKDHSPIVINENSSTTAVISDSFHDIGIDKQTAITSFPPTLTSSLTSSFVFEQDEDDILSGGFQDPSIFKNSQSSLDNKSHEGCTVHVAETGNEEDVKNHSNEIINQQDELFNFRKVDSFKKIKEEQEEDYSFGDSFAKHSVMTSSSATLTNTFLPTPPEVSPQQKVKDENDLMYSNEEESFQFSKSDFMNYDQQTSHFNEDYLNNNNGSSGSQMNRFETKFAFQVENEMIEQENEFMGTLASCSNEDNRMDLIHQVQVAQKNLRDQMARLDMALNAHQKQARENEILVKYIDNLMMSTTTITSSSHK